MPFLRKYGTLTVTGTTAIRIPLIKRGVVDFAVSADYTPSAGDVKVAIDGAAAANVTNLPTAVAMGNTAYWEFIPTAAELTCKQAIYTIADSATKAVEDQSFIVETFGHASAMYAADLSLANLPANVTQLLGTAWLTPGTAGTPDVNAKLAGGTAWGSGAITAASIAADAITAAKIADGAIDAATFAANAITSTVLATDCIGAAQLKADAVTEMALGVWSKALSGDASIAVGAAGWHLRFGTIVNFGAIVGTGSTTTSVVLANGPAVGTCADQLCTVIYADGSIESSPITSYDPNTGTLTLTEELPTAPLATVDVVVVTARHIHPTSQIAAAVWNALTSGITTAGSIGKRLLDLFNGITSLASWLGAGFGKQTADSTALTEINATGAGSGTFAGGASDSLEAISDAIPTTAEIFAATLTTQMTEAYAADGTAPTLAQAIFLIQQSLHEFSISSTTRTVKKLDGSTTAATFTLDSATAPTSTTRAT